MFPHFEWGLEIFGGDILDTKTKLVESVVGFAKEISFNDIPEDVIQHAKLVLLDTLGAVLAASHPKYSAGRILTEIIEDLG